MDLFKIMGTIALTGGDVVSSTLDFVTNKARETSGGFGNAMVNVGQSITTAGQKLLPFSLAMAGLAGVSTKTASTFSDSMLKVQSLSGATGAEFDKLRQTALDFGSSTAWSASEVADAMGYMALAGFDAGEIMQSTSGMLNLASASGENLATVTDILTDSMTAFGDSAQDANRYADVLATTQAKSNTTVGMLGDAFKYVAPLAGSFGYKMEDVATSLGMMANAGVKGSMAGTSLSAVMTRLGNNTSGARDAIESLGVEFFNADGTARNLSDVMKDLADATANMTVEEKANFATTVAGQEAQKGLLAILNQGSEAYGELEDSIKNCNGSAEGMAENMESGIGGAIRSMKSAIEGASIALGDAMAPTIQSVAEKIASLAKWFSELPAPLQSAIAKAILFGATLAPMLLIIGKTVTGIGVLINVFTKLKTSATLLKEGFVLAKAGFTGLGMEASWLGSTLGTFASSLTVGMVAPILAVVAVIGVLVGAFKHLWETSGMFRAQIYAVLAGVQAKFAEFNEAITSRLNALGFDFGSVIDALKALWDGFCNMLAPVFIGAFQFIATVLGTVLDVLVGLFDIFAGIFSGNFTQVWTGIKEVFTAIWNGVLNQFKTILNAMKGVANVVLGWFGTSFNKVWTAIKTATLNAFNQVRYSIASGLNSAKSTVSSVLDGIKSKFKSIWDTCVNTVKTAINKLKSAMNFSWSLPKLKLPHITISGSFSINPPSAPSFGISWYKKAMDNPYMFSDPTIFGYNPMTGTAMGAGEAGDEIMYGKSNLMRDISVAVGSQNDAVIDRLERIKDVLEDFISEAIPRMDKDIVLDSGALVGATAPAINVALGNIARREGR